MDKQKAPKRAAATASGASHANLKDAHLLYYKSMDLSMRACYFLNKEDKLMRFYVNKNAQSNGDHEVHRATCDWLPDVNNRIYLGDFNTSSEVVLEARKYYSQVDGCRHCCPESHTH